MRLMAQIALLGSINAEPQKYICIINVYMTLCVYTYISHILNQPPHGPITRMTNVL